MKLFKILTSAVLALSATTLWAEENEMKSFDLAAIIYDTDASLHGAFTCAPNWSPGQTPAQTHANACFYPSVKYPVVSSAAGEVPCIGVTQGMVESTLAIDPETKKKRMKLTSKGKKCFGAQADEAFAAMFTSTPGVNETYCYDMTFKQTSDGEFEFDSDTYQSPGAPAVGGFYPAEETPADYMMMSDRLPAAENKRKAEGPVFFCPDYNNVNSATPEGLRTIHPTEGVPVSDLICNGPGWNGGIDCEHIFAGGSEFNDVAVAAEIQKKLGVTYVGDGWGWSCSLMGPLGWTYYKEGTEIVVGTMIEKNKIVNDKGETALGANPRWTSGTSDSYVLTTGGRNQHFCFESHANFRFKKGLKFSFRGDDDIWVFIDNKLAVDIGGLHLAAPGYVDLDAFMGSYAIQDELYDIDIYFCDRRTQMSNIHIKTNMFIEQRTGIEFTQDLSETNNTENGKIFKICYSRSGNGNCAAALGGEQRLCGDEILTYGHRITYTLTKDQTNSDPSAAIISEDNFAVNPIQLEGSIDVTNPAKPIINEEKLKENLPNGTYYLVIKIDNYSKNNEIVIEDSKVKEESSSSKTTSSSSSKGSVSKSSSSNSSTGKSSSSNKVTSSSSKGDSKSSSSAKSSNSKSSSSKGNNSKDKDDEKNETSKPSFRVKMTAPFEFEIVMDESLPSLAKRYAVMDMKGQVLSVGEFNNAETRVKVPTSGSYIVKVGLSYKRVNVK